MASRPGIAVDAKVEAQSGIGEHQYSSLVSVHLRVNWPPFATDEEIEQALTEAVADARTQLAARWRIPDGEPAEGVQS